MPDSPTTNSASAAAHAAVWRPRTLAQKFNLSLYLIVIGIGYLTAFFFIIETTESKDGASGMTPDDVLIKYHGDRTTTPIARVLRAGSMPPEDAPVRPSDEEVEFLARFSLSDDKSEATFAKAHDGGDSPQALIGRYCGKCHVGTLAEADVSFGPTEQEITFESVEPYLQPDTGAGNLLSLTHTHLFGMATFLFLASAAFVLTTRYGPRLKLALGSLPLLAILGDVGSWWLTHWFGAPFQYVIMGAGAVMGGSVAAIIVLTLYDYWLRKPTDASAESPA